MQNKVNSIKVRILKETFSIENVSFNEKLEDVFLLINEAKSRCVVFSREWTYKCLQIDTVYDAQESGVFKKCTHLFEKDKVSIFAFTSINHGYFFFEEKFQKQVESHILANI